VGAEMPMLCGASSDSPIIFIMNIITIIIVIITCLSITETKSSSAIDHPSAQKIHQTILSIARFLYDFSRKSTSTPDFLRLGE